MSSAEDVKDREICFDRVPATKTLYPTSSRRIDLERQSIPYYEVEDTRHENMLYNFDSAEYESKVEDPFFPYENQDYEYYTAAMQDDKHNVSRYGESESLGLQDMHITAQPCAIGAEAETGKESDDSADWNEVKDYLQPLSPQMHDVNDVNDETSYSGRGAGRGKKLRERGFVPLGWQRTVPMGEVTRLYKVISSYWPEIDDPKVAQNWDLSISKYLKKRPLLLQRLTQDDQRAWSEVLAYSRPEAMMERSRAFKPDTMPTKGPQADRLTSVGWIAGKIMFSDVQKIFSRLREYWGGVSRAIVQGRMITYVEHCGKIQSPEPLIHGDADDLKSAADVIFNPNRPNTGWHKEAGYHDILHQFSEKYNVLDAEGSIAFVPYKVAKTRSDAPRYHTGQEWMNGMKQTQIDALHNAVARHFATRIGRKKHCQLLVRVNQYLEENPEALEDIEKGCEVASWEAAKAVIGSTKYLESYGPPLQPSAQ